jgi:hypothetical protein
MAPIFIASRKEPDCATCASSIGLMRYWPEPGRGKINPCNEEVIRLLHHPEKTRTPTGFHRAGFINSGDVLLSHNLEMHYHWGCSVSLPCSEWERVGPLRYDHQKAGEAEASPWGECSGAVSPQLHQKIWPPIIIPEAEASDWNLFQSRASNLFL